MSALKIGLRYQGSKARHAKEIIAVIEKLSKNKNGAWVEPFVGGCNMLALVHGRRRIGADISIELIALYKALQNGRKFPEHVSEKYYLEIKNNCNDLALRGYAGFCFGFGGKYFGTYRRNIGPIEKRLIGPKTFKNSTILEAAASNIALSIVERLRPYLKGIRFYTCSYENLVIPPKSIIYCDIPYEGTSGYGVNFNHTHFWLWAERMARAGHDVFISEYKAPLFAKEVWKKQVKLFMSSSTGASRKDRIEKLFKL